MRTLPFLFGSGALLTVASAVPWLRAVKSQGLGDRLHRALLAAYGTLFGAVSASTLASVVLGLVEPGTAASARVLWALSLALVPQAAVFAFIFTPVVMHVQRRRRSFWETAIWTECTVILPVLGLFTFCVWVLLNEAARLSSL